MESCPLDTKPNLPEQIEGNAWYLYLDSGIAHEDLQLLTGVVGDEIKFINDLLNPSTAEP